MADIIQLLPDSIANQIAAGEVIQRPASVVKELVENAIDAQATNIKLIIKDSGKTLIQIVDDGVGMSDTDARMSFERHATSKIKKADDLFEITTKGFRGEALASIGAIAQVELLTRSKSEELGTKIHVEGSKIKKQEPVQSPVGSNFSVRNLFFNVPARRKFLKSDPVELRHIIEEFHRISLAHPEVFFSFYHNQNEIFHLSKGNLRQRITSLFGKSYKEKLVPVKENTDLIRIAGFIGKPESAKKTKGGQYLFVNRRYVKSHYLNHAIRSCYDELITKDHHPFYVLFLEIEPSSIDINVHPTKTEIKFAEERLIYNYLKVSIKHALGQYHVTPALDFEMDPGFRKATSFPSGKRASGEKPINSPAHFQKVTQEFQKDNQRAWQSLYEGIEAETPNQPVTVESQLSQTDYVNSDQNPSDQNKDPYQIHNRYIISQIKSGFLLIDQQAAHERILYEKYLKSLESQGLPTQKQLFPQTIELPEAQSQTLQKMLGAVNKLGFDLNHFGQNTFVIHGTPVGSESVENGKELIEKLLHQYENNLEFELGINENLARSLAISTALKRSSKLSIEEMHSLIDQLFACAVPYNSPSGRKCFISMELDEIKKRFTP